MKKFYFLTAVILAAVAISATAFAVGSSPEAKDVKVRFGTGTAAVLLDLHNNGLLPDCLVGVEVMGDPMGGESFRAELHRTVMEDNVMKMVKVDKVCVNPFGGVRMRGMEGEGYHIMVFGDVESVKLFHVYLKFESGKTLHLHVETSGAYTGEGSHGEHNHG